MVQKLNWKASPPGPNLLLYLGEKFHGAGQL
jgi:hypothetical protein